MEKDFDRWNGIKKKLAHDTISPLVFPEIGEVWVCTLGKNLGREQNGGLSDFSRPALVIKKFNNEMFWVVPLTTKQKPFDFYFNFTDPNGAPVAAILAQLRLVSINRFRRVLYVLPKQKFLKICRKLSNSITPNRNPAVGRGFSAPSEPEGTVKA